MYILSTMLYSTLTNCASMLGSAVRQHQRANVVAAEVSLSFHLSRFLFYPLRTALNTPADFIAFKFTDEAIRFFLDFYYVFFPRKHQPRGTCFSHPCGVF